MAPDPALQEQIYLALKDDLRRGVLWPDVHIDLQGVSDRHRASVTPVREAVCRLMGEGLAEFQRYGGFRVAHVDADELVELYTLNATLVAAALRLSSDAAIDRAIGLVALPPPSAGPVEIATAAAEYFESLARASSNRPLARMIERISDRIAFARITETYVLRDTRGEFLMMTHGPRATLRSTLARRVSLYHRRRIDRIVMIAERAFRPSPT